MNWEPRPIPDVTPETAPYWAGAAEGKLMLNECRDCGLVYYYPRANCPDCFSDDVAWTEAAGTGEVYSFSVAKTMSGWPDADLPLVVAYVELDEGPRMIANVDADPEDIEIGTRVEVFFAETDTEDVAIPLFTPVEN